VQRRVIGSEKEKNGYRSQPKQIPERISENQKTTPETKSNPHMPWRILCYHRIDENGIARFANQLRWFKQKNVEFVSLSKGLSVRRNRNKEYMTISFDDGDISICRGTQELLRNEGIPAILYVATDFVVKGWIYKGKNQGPAVSWKDLANWLAAGNEIGGHTHTHIDCRIWDENRWTEELDTSERLIEEELGVRTIDFAYPWGYHNMKTKNWFEKQKGWRSAAIIKGCANFDNFDPFLLARFALTAEDNLREVSLVFVPRWKRIIGRIQSRLLKGVVR
jgi:peptidoglycan/xylan/chitin deacetylase (PgdA/CDA1 family)